MGKGVDKATQTHFDASEVTIKQNTSGLDSWLKVLERKPPSAMNGSVVVTDHLKKL